jgi:hypothetical protein
MADYLTVSSEPSFSEVLGAVTENDPAHPDTWNPQYHALLENDHWLRAAILATQGQVEDILGSDPINLSDRLDALVEYGAQRVFVERREQVPTFVVTSAVGGDDSIELRQGDRIAQLIVERCSQGDTHDDETGEHHLAHKLCCDLFRLELALRGEQ